MLRLCLILCGLTFFSTGQASDDSESLIFSHSGYPGLIQVPSAFLPDAGTAFINSSFVRPYRIISLGVQPFDWLHAIARYTVISDRRYCAGCEHKFLDKSFDFSVRLLKHSDYLPQLAFGIIDLGGTGLLSSEYLVASRRYFEVVGSLGITWGRMGSRGDVKNPLIGLSKRFGVRDKDFGQGGLPSVGRWFSGERAALIGGLEWQPAFESWSIAAEWEGNSYVDDPTGEPIQQNSRINVGLKYQYAESGLVSLSYQRGDVIGLQIAYAPKVGFEHRQIRSRRPLPKLDRLISPTYQTVPKFNGEPLMDILSLHKDLRQQNLIADAINIDSKKGEITLWQYNRFSSDPLDGQRATGRVVFSYLSEEIQNLSTVNLVAGAPTYKMTTPRYVIEADAVGLGTEEEVAIATTISSEIPQVPGGPTYTGLLDYPTMAYGIDPALRSNIGGLTGYYVGELQLKPYLTWQLFPSFSLTARLAFSVLGDLDRLVVRDSSNLPEVRSDVEKYQSSSGRLSLSQLEANYFFRMAPDWFGRLSTGITDEFFGGVGTEILYRPLASRLAWGVNINYVRKRDYDLRLKFLDYSVATGHLSLYYDTPFKGVQIYASFGRYLAKDVGATLQLSKRFANGTEFGTFATKTNVSSEQFGEGSFDKGFFLRIPLSVILPGKTNGSVGFDYKFLSRDGGQKVRDGRALYGVFGEQHLGRIYN